MNKTISELKPGDKRVTLIAYVVKMDKPRDIKTKYGKTKIREALIEDVTGNVLLVLWGEQAFKISEGNKIEIINGYVTERDKILQVSVGKYGSIRVIEES